MSLAITSFSVYDGRTLDPSMSFALILRAGALLGFL